MVEWWKPPRPPHPGILQWHLIRGVAPALRPEQSPLLSPSDLVHLVTGLTPPKKQNKGKYTETTALGPSVGQALSRTSGHTRPSGQDSSAIQIPVHILCPCASTRTFPSPEALSPVSSSGPTSRSLQGSSCSLHGIRVSHRLFSLLGACTYSDCIN